MLPSPIVKNKRFFRPSQVGRLRPCSRLRLTVCGAMGAPESPAACITSGTGLGRISPCCVIASSSWVTGLAVVGSNIFENMPSIPTTDQRVILFAGVVTDILILLSIFNGAVTWKSATCRQGLAGTGPRTGCQTGSVDQVRAGEAAYVAEHLGEIRIHREVHKITEPLTLGVAVTENVRPGNQTHVVVATLGSLARLQMVMRRIAERRKTLAKFHRCDPVCCQGFCSQGRDECLHFLYGRPDRVTVDGLKRLVGTTDTTGVGHIWWPHEREDVIDAVHRLDPVDIDPDRVGIGKGIGVGHPVGHGNEKVVAVHVM